ncbi:alginate export family protein [Lujinxingia vulgaris]|nr:alginate export family protein [Lujinxingia vulgaris]
MSASHRIGFLVLIVVWTMTLPGLAGAQEGGEGAAEAAPGARSEPEQATSWSLSARVRPRVEARFNHHFGLAADELNYGGQPDEADVFSQQTRVGLKVARGRLSGRLTLQHSAAWGDFGGDSLTAPPLALYQGWVRFEATETFFADVGRFELAYGDQRVLGSVGWSQVGRAWDGVRLGLRPGGGVAVDAFAARYQDGAGGFLDDDAYLSGVYASMGGMEAPLLREVDVYVLYDARLGREPSAEGAGDGAARRNLVMLGSRLEGAAADARLTLEGGYQLGSVCAPEALASARCQDEGADIGAFFFDSTLSYALGVFTPFVGFSLASGDDPESADVEAYNHLYPTAHAFMGYMDLIGARTNIRELRAGLRFEGEGLNAELVAHDFTRQQPSTERVGLEINAQVAARFGDGFSLGAGHGLFVPDQGVSNSEAAPQGVANWTYLQAVGSF